MQRMRRQRTRSRTDPGSYVSNTTANLLSALIGASVRVLQPRTVSSSVGCVAASG